VDLVAVREHRRGHRFTVDIGAVEAADVRDLEFTAFPSELGVPAADGDVVEVDVAVGMPALCVRRTSAQASHGAAGAERSSAALDARIPQGPFTTNHRESIIHGERNM
jgi:hypothetical protein